MHKVVPNETALQNKCLLAVTLCAKIATPCKLLLILNTVLSLKNLHIL